MLSVKKREKRNRMRVDRKGKIYAVYRIIRSAISLTGWFLPLHPRRFPYAATRRVLHKSPVVDAGRKRERDSLLKLYSTTRRSPPADFQSSSQRGIWRDIAARYLDGRSGRVIERERCAPLLSYRCIDTRWSIFFSPHTRSAFLCLSTNRPPEQPCRSLMVDRKRKSIARLDSFIGKKKEFCRDKNNCFYKITIIEIFEIIKFFNEEINKLKNIQLTSNFIRT